MFSIGKTYLTKRGDKVRIIARIVSDAPWVGVVTDDDTGEQDVLTWRNDGRFLFAAESFSDLTTEEAK